MNQQNEVPLYATLLYKVREVLGISWNEYIYLDMVQKLHIHRQWCSKSVQKCADDLGFTKDGLMKMRARLLELGLLEKNEAGHVRVTAKYTEVAVNKVYRSDEPVEKSASKSVYAVRQSVDSVYRGGIRSSFVTGGQNNKRITKNKGLIKKPVAQPVEKTNPSYLKAKARSEYIRLKPDLPFDQWFSQQRLSLTGG